MVKVMNKIIKILSVLFIFGCANDEPNDWGVTLYSPNGVTADVGIYKFNQKGCFEVSGTAIQFSVDCIRWDTIWITNGSFSYSWGSADVVTCPNCSCPTDGYAIGGHFTAPTKAEGFIIYGACNYDFPLTQIPFTATLVQSQN